MPLPKFAPRIPFFRYVLPVLPMVRRTCKNDEPQRRNSPKTLELRGKYPPHRFVTVQSMFIWFARTNCSILRLARADAFRAISSAVAFFRGLDDGNPIWQKTLRLTVRIYDRIDPGSRWSRRSTRRVAWFWRSGFGFRLERVKKVWTIATYANRAG